MTTRTLSEIRKILMEEHADIRAQIEETRAATTSSDTARQRSCLAVGQRGHAAPGGAREVGSGH